MKTETVELLPVASFTVVINKQIEAMYQPKLPISLSIMAAGSEVCVSRALSILSSFVSIV